MADRASPGSTLAHAGAIILLISQGLDELVFLFPMETIVPPLILSFVYTYPTFICLLSIEIDVFRHDENLYSKFMFEVTSE